MNPDVPEQSESWQLIDYEVFRNKPSCLLNWIQMFRNNLSPDSWLILICSGTNWVLIQVNTDVPEQFEPCWQLIDSGLFRNKLINYPSENKCFGTIWDIVQVNPDVPEQSESWQLIDSGWFRNKLNYNTQVKINVPEQSESWQLIDSDIFRNKLRLCLSVKWIQMFRNNLSPDNWLILICSGTKLSLDSSEYRVPNNRVLLTIDWFCDVPEQTD